MKLQSSAAVLLILLKSLLCEGISYRLATTVDPVFYSLKLQPDLDKGVFDGEVSIRIKVKNVVKSILLHSSELTIDEVYLDQRKDGLQIDLHPKYELMEIRRENTSVSPGMHNIFIRFRGSLLDKHRGFYKAMYSDADGNVSFLAITDFQPTFARHAFPCFDEPAFKARFQVTLVAPNSSYTALSNMRRIKIFATSYGVVHKFETSCVMSPYLLAFSINKYSYGEYVYPNPGGNVPIRVYSLNASNENNAKTLCFAARSLNFYNKYTELPYPLPKLDFIEYDRSHSGATENWGLVTTKLGILSPKLNLYDETQIANVISHELAHFWFGNLVTNKWWDDIWLQEGFAVFMALKAEEYLLMNNATLEFGGRFLPDVYQADQSMNINAVVSNVESPESIRRHFNDITYVKGAAILRMVELVLGEEVFRQALQMYLKRFQYKTACTNDFINIVESFAASDVAIRSFLETYLYQNRYPIIEVTEDEESNAYVLRQVNREISNETESPYKHKWTIPIYYTTNLEEKALVWFDKDMESLSIPRKKEKWIKFNYKEIGYYRIIYSKTLWNKFYVHCEEMSAFNRKNLLSEAIQLYRLDLVPCEIPLMYMDFTGNSKVLPLTQMWFFLNQAREEMAGFDKKTFNVLWSYIQALMKKAGYKTKFNFNLMSSDITKPEAVPGRVTSCIKWINENLYSKIKNDTAPQ